MDLNENTLLRDAFATPRGDRACTVANLLQENIASFFLFQSVIRYDYAYFPLTMLLFFI